MPGEFGRQNNSGFQYDEKEYEDEVQQKLQSE